MCNIYTEILDRWHGAGSALVAIANREEVSERFRAAGLIVASDFIEFYSAVGGMEDSETDGDLWSCWSINKIIMEASSYPREGVPFGDWMIHSHLHVVRPESDNQSSVWVDYFSGDFAEKVADSLDDFLIRYIKKDETTLIFFDEPSVRNRKKPNKMLR